ncbi:hypothetical protein [Streptomyces sp. NPDC087859]|uniref:hypothetical protein n=1 Tax=Streptomyces sp. NPDC087859 TaxID=3365812 RepID=UPI003801274A
MRQYELPVLGARNTAMTETVADLPPIVVSDLFGMHPNSAPVCAQYAQDSWADDLVACQDEEWRRARAWPSSTSALRPAPADDA